MKRYQLMASSLLLVAGLAGCGDQPTTSAGSDKPASPSTLAQPERWYSQLQVERGDPLFQAHCAECHLPDASGTPDWRSPLADGKYPPPPLNGTAHAWHHPLSVLRRTVRIGGVPLGGTMPGFADKLSAEQIDDILAWVQTHWSDEIYRIWHERNTQSESRLPSIKKG
jgi:mono/diheme cytochrome c family protein